VNWGNENMMNTKVKIEQSDENMMNTKIKVEQSDFNSTEILNDDVIEQIGHEVKELIELLDDDDDDDNNDNHLSPVRYPGLTKRNYEDNGNYICIIVILDYYKQIKY